jgi:hypothetical protein
MLLKNPGAEGAGEIFGSLLFFKAFYRKSNPIFLGGGGGWGGGVVNDCFFSWKWLNGFTRVESDPSGVRKQWYKPDMMIEGGYCGLSAPDPAVAKMSKSCSTQGCQIN